MRNTARRPRHILFLRAGNPARSILAGALLDRAGDGRSAGATSQAIAGCTDAH